MQIWKVVWKNQLHVYKHENENYEDNEEIEDDDIKDDECDIEGMGDDSQVCGAENVFFNASVETEKRGKKLWAVCFKNTETRP